MISEKIKKKLYELKFVKKIMSHKRNSSPTEIMNDRMSISNRVGLSIEADIMYCKEGVISFSINPSNSILIFIALKNTLQPLIEFIQIFDILEHLTDTTLVMGCTDASFPIQTDKRYQKPNSKHIETLNKITQNKRIKTCYMSNYDNTFGSIRPYPLGLAFPKTKPKHLDFYKKYDKSHNIMERKIGILSSDRVRNKKGQWKDRGIALNNCKPGGIWYNIVHLPSGINSTHEHFLNNLTKFPFIVCIHGGGLDPCPKLWEALLCGTIPIINKHSPLTDVFQDYPVIIIDNVLSYKFNIQELEEWRKKYSYFFTNSNERNILLNKLTLKYWTDKMRVS